MRILNVSASYESHGGGIERVAGHLCRALGAAGHEVCWAASDGDPLPDEPRIDVLPLACINPIERWTGLPAPLPLSRARAKLSRAAAAADAVIVHDALYATSLAAARAARLHGKPLVLLQHIAAIPFRSPVLRALMYAANRFVTEPMIRSADQVVFISDTVRRDFARVRTRRAPRLIFNGVDSQVFRPGSSERASFGLPEDGVVAAFAGRFVEKKGLAVLREVARLRPETAFALAGTGPIDPASWGLANVYVLGRLSRERIAALFRSADTLLLPSVGEGYPLVVQEAMASGLPVLCGEESARADPAAVRWLRGVPIDLGDPAGTARAVAQALDFASADAASRAQMAAYATSTYDWGHMASELARITQSLIAEQKDIGQTRLAHADG